ncbi:MBL fold metallo-hydrolase [Rhodococcus fascians]|uniref:MBL fold metallo-hydrolase n=1 Tax=Nocardiaceae TaxID=85025 RepID=UPI00070F580C|nr:MULTISPECIES: MBL fold metallo-hydrolase [Rhodococcus]MDP9635306.1 glyoxylase-like metal-dependent hydrolase (beta-lactamase superfamily II) [Rhodococcus cercidiphylli]KQU32884.1 hypothetical protein ASH04_12450 [Rhodococcus sp. Leaf233]MBY3986548.1 MBL fold metallo-hydrolase [Rhodococcus fascians]MBY3996905.1 MBL fold metallo-hydrolase [Rhodococcus fascians]MBY4000931.1 MBL fold metallo-hydrolase [Rhodococcus fascians]
MPTSLSTPAAGTAKDSPGVGPWFRSRSETATLTRIDEPSVHPLLQANVWHLRGRDRDLIVDTGLGVASLRGHLPHLFDRDPIVVVTHAHLDHMGGAHEFDTCLAHADENLTSPPPGSLRGAPLGVELGMDLREFGVTDDTILLDALPEPDYDIDLYRLRPASTVLPVEHGATIDLGDVTYTVLHLPGHTPGGIALYSEHDGTLFSGDVVYDDILIDRCHGSNVADYRRSMAELAALDVARAYAGHGDSFDGNRLRTLTQIYLDESR